MGSEPITCRFIFTSAEYMRSIRCHWFHPPAVWSLGFIVLIILGVEVYLYSNPDAQHPAGLAQILLNLLPFVVFFLAVLFTKWLGFISRPVFGKEMIFTFQEEGVRLQNPIAKTEAKWEIFSRVIEAKSGFAIYFKPKAFHWLPKSGFPSQESIKLCRELFRKNIKDSRHLFAS